MSHGSSGFRFRPCAEHVGVSFQAADARFEVIDRHAPAGPVGRGAGFEAFDALRSRRRAVRRRRHRPRRSGLDLHIARRVPRRQGSDRESTRRPSPSAWETEWRPFARLPSKRAIVASTLAQQLHREVVAQDAVGQHRDGKHLHSCAMPLQEDLGENFCALCPRRRDCRALSTVSTGDDHVLDVLEGDVTAAGAVIQATVGIASDSRPWARGSSRSFPGPEPDFGCTRKSGTRAF